MKLVALTGGIATGKSTVAKMFEALGVPVIDSDRIVHEILKSNGKAIEDIASLFGRSILASDGTIDRKALADVVFEDSEKRKELEAIIHPLVKAEIEKQVAAIGNSRFKYVIVEVPLLFEAKWEGGFDKVIVVACDFEEEIRRCSAKFGISRQIAETRINAQMPLREKISRADFVIDNNAPIEKTLLSVKRIYDSL